MAIIWERTHKGCLYQVRSAGNTRRLYTDGVFHSQYNDRHPVTGSVWDLLLLPAFFYPRGRLRRVLVLGVGGGAVIRQLQHFIQPQRIVGVELNPLHLTIARRFFGVRGPSVELVQADAIAWARRYRGPKFDMIIDDLFGEDDGEPMRAIAANADWAGTLLKHLAQDGVLVSNFISGRELRESAYCSSKSIRSGFENVFQFTTPLYENAVGAFLRVPASVGGLHKTLVTVPFLNPDLKSSRLKYCVRSMK